MKDRLFVRMSALPLMMSVLSGAMWVHSHYACDRAFCYRELVDPGDRANYDHHGLELSSFEGELVLNDFREYCTRDFLLYPPPPAAPLVDRGLTYGIHSAWDSPRFVNLGGGGHTLIWGCQSRILFRLPYWLIFLLCASAVPFQIKRLFTRQPRPGFCDHCGYDLRATPDRCPECGTIPKPTVAKRD